MDNLEDKFNKAQQDLIDKFKVKMTKACDEVLGEVYCDVVNYASTDAHINYHNYLRDEFKKEVKKKVLSEYGHYSWAHEIRMDLLNNHKEELQNKIITDLKEIVKSQNEQIQELYESTRRGW